MSEPAMVPAPAWAASQSAVRTRTIWAVLAIAAAGWLLRALPLIQAGTFGYPVDYDEGVYFASSALLLKGALPYRDFTFVHPPSLLYILAPAAWLGLLRDPTFGFAAARWFVTIIGLANVLVVGRLAMRSAGTVGAIAAAAVYATHPAAVWVERGPFLEPLLNLCCLCLAWAWLAGADRKGWHTILAGVLCGLAISVKAWGALWLAACVLSGWRHRSRGDLMAFVASAAITCLALCAPLALAAPMAFFSQVFSFHLHRPPDGPLPGLDRLGAALWMHGQLLKSAFVAGGLILALTGSRDAGRRDARFFAAAFILILAAFLVSSTYWSQYNGHLAVPESWLAGFAAAGLWRWAERGSNRIRAALALGLVAAVLALGARRSILTGRKRSPDLVGVGQFVRSNVPIGSYVVSFEPAWRVAGGRLPDRAERLIIVDSYAMMLIDATRGGRRFPSATEAFRDPASQSEILEALRACRFAIIGDRGYWQMSPDTQDWLRTRFVQRFPPPGREGIDVWERAP